MCILTCGALTAGNERSKTHDEPPPTVSWKLWPWRIIRLSMCFAKLIVPMVMRKFASPLDVKPSSACQQAATKVDPALRLARRSDVEMFYFR